jgi:cytochrome c553
MLKTRLLIPLALLASFASAQAQDTNLARNLAATCANCHGTQGVAKGEMKSLAGRPAAELIQFMNEFRSGSRPATIMHQISKGYTDEQIRLVAGFFAAQPAAK